MRRGLHTIALAAAVLLLAGCETIGYYSQALSGQIELATRARPLEEAMQDPAVPPEVREKLALAREIREFASRELALPDNGSYRRYADLGRPFVVWNVFATPEFSTKPLESCFPVTGCVSYRGFFGEADARRYAERLRAGGNDVQVSGIPAYSTLGWFDDPLLSTFIRYPETELARLVFHELAHQVLYIKNDTDFNESFAVAVERAGVRRWLATRKREGDYATFFAVRERQREFIAMIARAKVRMDAIYAEDLPPEAMREAKKRGFAQMMVDYAALKAGWKGFAGYDRIVGTAPGNALLASITAYSKFVPGFEKMLEDAGGDMTRFYAEVRRVSELPKVERCKRLLPDPASSAECSRPR